MLELIFHIGSDSVRKQFSLSMMYLNEVCFVPSSSGRKTGGSK